MYQKLKNVTLKDGVKWKNESDKHHEYISKLKDDDFKEIALLIAGLYMSNWTAQKFEKRSEKLQNIINNAPKLSQSVSLLRAQFNEKLPQIGDILSWKRPKSFSMFHAFALEWLLDRPISLHRTKKCIILVKLPKGFNDALCIGKPNPLSEESSFFKKVVKNIKKAFTSIYPNGYDQQLETQCEVLLGKNTQLQVTKINKMNSKNINNFEYYGLGWFPGIFRKEDVYVIECKVFEQESNKNQGSLIRRSGSSVKKEICKRWSIKDLREEGKRKGIPQIFMKHFKKENLCNFIYNFHN